MIKINTEVLELFLYYWQATSEKEKVSDVFLSELAARPELKVLFTEEFNGESIRKVLSSITNREILSSKTKEEGRFWNNNMWMLEDLGLTLEMMAPVKQLNGEGLASFVTGDWTITFIPGHVDTLYRKPGELFVNFFKLALDPMTMKVSIEGDTLEVFLEKALALR